MKSSNVLSCLVVYVCLLLVTSGGVGGKGLSTSRCNRQPSTVNSPKTSGDNGYEIQVLGNPNKYYPGETYTVKLQGVKTAVSTQKFHRFMLVVEPSDDDKDTGQFKLYDDVHTRFSDECPNAVIETSSMVKGEVKVVWIAPKPGSGCVKFKATVVEIGDQWLMDDGRLTKEFCEEEVDGLNNGSDEMSECCSCDDAKYEVTFQGLWSRHTHPKDFPSDNFLTHFSDIIGASHSPAYTMWANGGEASEGLKAVAEAAQTRLMEAEMKQQSHNIRTIIKARSLLFPNLNGSTFAVFRVDQKHHLMSLVSMLGPSPDWFTGVSRMELCLKNCSWITSRTVDLFPWDAGTDSGVTYMVHTRRPTIPRDKIRRITTSYPNDPASPFYDTSGEPMKPVARLTLTRQRLYEKACEDRNGYTPEEVPTEPAVSTTTDPRMECTVTEWSEFTPCSATCGESMRMRTRQYLMPMKADMFACNTTLVEKTKCAFEPCDYECAMKSWSEWSECSVTCGKGWRTRSREYKQARAYKSCFSFRMEKEICMGVEETCITPIDPQCITTQWSEWSPCMVTCGKGTKIRTRMYINPKAYGLCREQLSQQAPCMADRPDCNLSFIEAKEVCGKGKDVGPCRGHYTRWYFDTVKMTCLQFSWGGCRGNDNNFKTYDECNRMCDIMKVPMDSSLLNPQQHLQQQQQQPIDCVWKWSAWSPCSVTCGPRSGIKTRKRIIKVYAQNGGKKCPRQMSQKRDCNATKDC